jgi:hypothetical protein
MNMNFILIKNYTFAYKRVNFYTIYIIKHAFCRNSSVSKYCLIFSIFAFLKHCAHEQASKNQLQATFP